MDFTPKPAHKNGANDKPLYSKDKLAEKTSQLAVKHGRSFL